MTPELPQGPMDRREFHKLTAAALSGLAAGAILGCGRTPAPAPATTPAAASGGAGPAAVAQVKAEAHLCRGLNDCKGQGKGSDNACRGQGVCATTAEHTCGGQNDCKGLGGCGETAGANDCKGQGGCHVPLMDDPWKKLREKKEAEWKSAKLEAGQPPAKAS